MAQQPSQSNTQREEATSKVFAEDSHLGLWSPEEEKPKRKPSQETGYDSAPYLSDLLSTTETTSDSTIWTSDDHDHEEARLRSARLLQKVHSRIPEEFLESSESTSKSDEPGDTSTVRRRKKTSLSQKKSVDASVQIDQEGPSTASQHAIPESTMADVAGCSTIKGAEGGISPRKSKSRFVSPKKAIMSIVSKIVSPMKQTRSSRLSQTPTDSRKQKKTGKSSSPKERSRKSPSKRSSSVSIFKSPARREATTSSLESEESHLEAEETRSSSKHGAISKIFSNPAKSRGQSKISKKSPRKQGDTSEVSKMLGSEASVSERPLEAPECPIFERMKKFPRADSQSHIKRRETVDSLKPQTSTSGEHLSSDSHQPRSSAYSLVKKGMKKMELTMSPRKGKRGGSDEIPLSGEPMDIDDPEETKQGTSDSEVKTAGAKEQKLSPVSRKTFEDFKSSQKDGFKYKDLTSTSAADEPLTDVSTVSDSSGFQDVSEQKQGSISSLQTVSLISLLEEEAVAGSSGMQEEAVAGSSGLQEEAVAGSPGLKGDRRRKLQRQKRVKASDSSGSDEESRALWTEFDSPCKKAAHGIVKGDPNKK